MSVVRRTVVACLVSFFAVCGALAEDPAAQQPAPASTPAAAPDPARAAELVKLANEAWHMKRDPNAAKRAWDDAVAAAPDDMMIRAKRGLFFEELAARVSDDKQKTWLKGLAEKDYREVIRREPDSVKAGVCRDGLQRLSNRRVLPETQVTCAPEAIATFDEAEALFNASRHEEAIAKFRRAADDCPASAVIWTAFADTYYMKRDYAMAKSLFERALEADPWKRDARRFLADTETRLEHLDAARRQAAFAVIADPTYEAAWSTYQDLAQGTGREWHRRWSEKVTVTAERDGKKKWKSNISLPDTLLTDGGADMAPWLSYGMVLAGVLTGTFDLEGKPQAKKNAQPVPATPFQQQRAAVVAALEVLGEVGAEVDGKAVEPKKEPGRFWSMMKRAQDAGFLDEAIYVHLLDEGLAPEYVAFRKDRSERLVEYLETVIAPPAPAK